VAKAGNPTSLALSLAIGVAVLGAASMIALQSVSTTGSTHPEPPHESEVLAACGGIAQAEIGLDREYPQSHAVVCFTIEERTTLTIGAKAADTDDLTLDIRSESGTLLASDDDTYGYDPEITHRFMPGTYVVAVSVYGGGDPGAFTLYTRRGAASAPVPDDAGPVPDFMGDLPPVGTCGNADVPLLVDSGEVYLDGDTAHACVQLVHPGFIKFGASTTPGNTANLRLAIFSVDAEGAPTFIGSVDDTFGTDPELSHSLSAGLYMVEVDTWNGAPVGSLTLYVSTTPTYFRQGQVAAQFSGARAEECTNGTLDSLVYGTTYTVPSGDDPRVCLSLSNTSLVEVSAVSPIGEDLTLEIIGFRSNGTPVRYGWVDYDFESSVGEDVAQVRLALPPGTYILAAAQFNGLPPSGSVEFSHR
jgi:hypothetical protein